MNIEPHARLLDYLPIRSKYSPACVLFYNQGDIFLHFRVVGFKGLLSVSDYCHNLEFTEKLFGPTCYFGDCCRMNNSFNSHIIVLIYIRLERNLYSI